MEQIVIRFVIPAGGAYTKRLYEINICELDGNDQYTGYILEPPCNSTPFVIEMMHRKLSYINPNKVQPQQGWSIDT